jgi:transcriptional regulator with GAF, ATPase, and Fis domain
MPATRTENNEGLYKGFTLDELEILLEISSIVTSNLDLDEILQSVHSHLPKLIPHKKSGIFFYHENTGKVTIH